MTTVNSLFLFIIYLFILCFNLSFFFFFSSNAKIKENENQLCCYSDCDISNRVSAKFKIVQNMGEQKIMFLRGNN